MPNKRKAKEAGSGKKSKGKNKILFSAHARTSKGVI